jgi:site-specific recombinase XerD
MTVEFFINRGLARSTAESYELALRDLKKFHGNTTQVENLTNEQICSYLKAVKSAKRLSAQTRNVRIYAFNYYFNKYLGYGYKFDEFFNPRNWKRSGKDFYIPSVEEVKLIIDNSASLRDKLMYVLGYGCGLDSGEVLSIKSSHIDLLRSRVKVKLNANKKYKYFPLSKKIIEVYELYINAYRPKKFLFYGRDIDKPLPQRTLQRAFQVLIEKLPVDDKINFRSLRHAYIIHLHRYGYNLWSILNQLSLDSSLSLKTYTQAAIELQEIDDSPIEYINSQIEDEPLNINSLISRLKKVVDGEERSYLHEAIMCLKNGLLRSGVMMAWTAAMANVYK